MRPNCGKRPPPIFFISIMIKSYEKETLIGMQNETVGKKEKNKVIKKKNGRKILDKDLC